MKSPQSIKSLFKEFGPTTWSIANKTSIYLLVIFVSVIGVTQFVTLPKEQFPDIVIPTIYVQTIYVGNSPRDIENLVTQPIEKQLKGITGAKINKLTSTSLQDYSAIVVEFGTDVPKDVALQKVKDAVDKAKTDLPTNLTEQPSVLEVNLSDIPIMYVNISGDYDMMRLKSMLTTYRINWKNCHKLPGLISLELPNVSFRLMLTTTKCRHQTSLSTTLQMQWPVKTPMYREVCLK